MDLRISRGYKLTEEIVRWRLEILIEESDDAWISFTNPTAGPWKRLMGRDNIGTSGEVMRFAREADRPDLVIVDDKTKRIFILEAKDDAKGLCAKEQVTKTVRTFDDLTISLKKHRSNKYWGARSTYDFIPGLVWGSSPAEAIADEELVRRSHASRFSGLAPLFLQIIRRESGELTVKELSKGAKLLLR